MTIKDKLILYLNKKINSLELEKEALLNQRHTMAMDSLDLYEHMRAEVRISAVNEVCSDILNILLYCDIKQK